MEYHERDPEFVKWLISVVTWCQTRPWPWWWLLGLSVAFARPADFNWPAFVACGVAQYLHNWNWREKRRWREEHSEEEVDLT